MPIVHQGVPLALNFKIESQVGDDIPLSKVLDEGSDWKGRREQLIALREQVKQLKAAQVRRNGERRNLISI